MSLRYGHLRRISRFLQHISSGHHLLQSRQTIKSLASSLNALLLAFDKTDAGFQRDIPSLIVSSRFSTVSKDSPSETDLLSFIKHSFDQPEGPHHCWVNKDDGKKDFLKKDGAFLVLAGRFYGDSEGPGSCPIISEKVKSLQQRFPQLNVIGFQVSSSVCFAADQNQLVQLIMKEFVTFPILLSNKKFSEMSKGACYILFKDFMDPVVYNEEELDFGVLYKAIEEIYVPSNGNSRVVDDLKSTWSKQVEVFKEPSFCSFLQNLLLYFPGCISADESGNRLFLSDSNHHRIIIFDSNGKILDCIGSCPGFEDGEFELAKLGRPGASFYHASEDCLYIVDSENHAIRRADLERRVLETVYPKTSINKKSNSLWTWILNKLGFHKNVDLTAEDLDFQMQSLIFPWHLMKLMDNNFLVINRSFETLWILDFSSGEIKEVVKGYQKILDVCEDLVMDKVSLLKQMPHDLLQQQTDANCSLDGVSYAGLISCITTFQNYIIMCDTVGQGVLKLSKESGILSNFHFSNFGILGLPYWLSFSLERVYAVAAGLPEGQADHVQSFSLLPGRIDIRLYVDIPSDTELVEPLQESCIWRQARGAATEVSGVEETMESSEKVGVAQQWYDELDNLAFSTPESELTVEDDTATSVTISQDGRIRIDCAVNTSSGTSEVIIYAALYLKLRRNPDLQEDNQEKYAARIADILNTGRSGGSRSDSCSQFLLKPNRYLRDLIFMKPLHVRIKLDSLSHPKANNSKNIILTYSSIDVNVSLA